MNFKGCKIILVGVITLVASLVLRFFGVVEPSAVVFLIGIVSCMVGIVVGTVNVIRNWWRRWREWTAKQQERRIEKTTTREKKRSFSMGQLIFWLSFVLLAVTFATRTEETGAAAIAKQSANTMLSYIALMGMCSGGVAWAVKRQKEDPKYQEQERQRREWEEQRRMERELALAISEVKLIGVSTEFKRGGLKGALLGGFLGGGIGAVVGAVTRNGKAVHRQRFAVKYKNGRTGTEEHEVGSRRYHELMRYVKWEDI